MNGTAQTPIEGVSMVYTFADAKAPSQHTTQYFEIFGNRGTGTLLVNGKKVAEGRIEQTQCCAFSADEGADVGSHEGSSVTEAYEVPFTFTGKIAKVTIELKEMKTAAAYEAKKAHQQAALKTALSD